MASHQFVRYDGPSCLNADSPCGSDMLFGHSGEKLVNNFTCFYVLLIIIKSSNTDVASM